jgi:glycosyltransferase involved in cell wall biosynthesis
VTLRDLGRVASGVVHGRRLAREAERLRTDAIVETEVHFSPSGGIAARRTGLPLLLDDRSPASEERALGGGLVWLARRILVGQARRAVAVVVPADTQKQRLIAEGVAPEKIRVVPNGIDVDAAAGPGEPLRRSLGLEDRCVLGYVGSFQHWHRVDLLVDAAARLAARHPMHLLLVGDGPARRAVIERAARAGIGHCLTAPGSVEPAAVPRWVRAFDLGVLPGSNDYGHPMKLLDYAAAGIPFVAPDLPPVREAIGAAPPGVLFAAGDVEALAGALERLIVDPARRAELGRQLAAAMLPGASWRDRARALLEPLAGR